MTEYRRALITAARDCSPDRSSCRAQLQGRPGRVRRASAFRCWRRRWRSGCTAPGLTILFEGGVIGAFVEPGKLPPSTNEQRCTKRANMVLGSADVLLLLQRGYVDVGFMGGAQIDQYGNLNSSFIGDPRAPEDAAAGHRRRQRHRQPDADDRRDEAREAPLRRAGRFHHQPGLPPRRQQPRAKAGCRPAACFASSPIWRCFRFRRALEADEAAGAAIPASPASRCRTTPVSSCCSTTDLDVTEPPTEHELDDAARCSIPIGSSSA